MRTKANLSLVLLALLFIGAVICLRVFSSAWWAHLLLYISEAGLVGALADLFAITALFRHPLGLKILPHTAIIPKNRDKLVDGVVFLVEEQLLSKHLLREKIQQFHFVHRGIAFVDSRGGSQGLADIAWDMIVKIVKRLDIESLSMKLDHQIRASLNQSKLSPYAGRTLRWVLDHSQYQGLLTSVVEFAANRISEEDTVSQIRDMLGQEKDKVLNKGGAITRWFKRQIADLAESSNALNLDDAAEVLFADLQRFMQELRSPEHELRLLISDMLYKLADELDERADVAQTVDSWKNELLDKISLLPSIQAVLVNVQKLLSSDPDTKYIQTDYVVHVRSFVDALIHQGWDWFKHNEEVQDSLEGYVQEFVESLIETEHAMIGQIVRQTLNEFTEQRLVEFIESKVDTDLQRIRLNGAWVGAVLGALFYLLLYGGYESLLHGLMHSLTR